MKKKSEVFSAFQEFKAEVENFHERKIKAFQTDGWGQYCSSQFVHRMAVARSSQQTGIAERMNRTIANDVKYC